jgi:adenine-specific DNA methylase
VEINPLSASVGNFTNHVDWVANVVQASRTDVPIGRTRQLDATKLAYQHKDTIVSCDPPYYDNIGYADLSDYFYIWLREPLKPFYPDLFGTLLTPNGSLWMSGEVSRLKLGAGAVTINPLSAVRSARRHEQVLPGTTSAEVHKLPLRTPNSWLLPTGSEAAGIKRTPFLRAG